MYQLIIVVHVFLGLGVTALVLMQQGKGADAGAAFSGGGSGSVFGAQGASSFLSRTTAILAALFFATSLGLAMLSGYESKSDDIMDEVPSIEKPLIQEDVPLIGGSVPSSDSVPVVDTPIIEDSSVPAPVAEIEIQPEATAIVEDAATQTESIPFVDESAPVDEPVITEDATPVVEETAPLTEDAATVDESASDIASETIPVEATE